MQAGSQVSTDKHSKKTMCPNSEFFFGGEAEVLAAKHFNQLHTEGSKSGARNEVCFFGKLN